MVAYVLSAKKIFYVFEAAIINRLSQGAGPTTYVFVEKGYCILGNLFDGHVDEWLRCVYCWFIYPLGCDQTSYVQLIHWTFCVAFFLLILQ